MHEEKKTETGLVSSCSVDCSNLLILETKTHNGQKKKLFHRKHLDQLRKGTNITQLEHDSLDIPLIVDHLCCSQNEWKSHKKKSASIRRQFLIERAELLADKLRTAEEKALRAILRAEDSR